MIDRVPRAISPEQRKVLQDLADIAVSAMELRRANKQLIQLATTDPLTDTLNRRSLFASARREAVARAKRYRQPLSR